MNDSLDALDGFVERVGLRDVLNDDERERVVLEEVDEVLSLMCEKKRSLKGGAERSATKSSQTADRELIDSLNVPSLQIEQFR